ncbi:MAG: hypothetical protein GXY91_01460 [Clostridia bacterium]|nr:hypothetical protein [Clostridia bacterium]
MKDWDIILEIETKISMVLDDLEQLAQLLQKCREERGWINFNDPLTGKACRIDEALKHIYTAHSEILAIDVCSCEREVV